MNVLEIIQEFCRRTGLPTIPSLSTNDDQALQILGLLNEILDDLEQRKVYTSLQVETTFTTVVGEDQGALTTLAPGYVKLLDNLLFNRTSNEYIFGNISSLEWQSAKAGMTSISQTQFRIQSGRLYLYPELSAGNQIAFEYQSRYAVRGSTGLLKSYFDSNLDICLYPDNIMILGLRWIWRREKGFRFADHKRDYEYAIANFSGNDTVGKVIHLDGGDEVRMGIIIPEMNWRLP